MGDIHQDTRNSALVALWDARDRGDWSEAESVLMRVLELGHEEGHRHALAAAQEALRESEARREEAEGLLRDALDNHVMLNCDDTRLPASLSLEEAWADGWAKVCKHCQEPDAATECVVARFRAYRAAHPTPEAPHA